MDCWTDLTLDDTIIEPVDDSLDWQDPDFGWDFGF